MNRPGERSEAGEAGEDLARHLAGGVRVEVPRGGTGGMRALACVGAALAGMAFGTAAYGHEGHFRAHVSADAKTAAAGNLAEGWRKAATAGDYRKVVSMIREQVYREVPGARGKIDIFDQSADPAAEVRRIGRSLGRTTSMDRDPKASPGFANMDFGRGRYTCVAVGLRLDAGSLGLAARAILHEVGHCLDGMRRPEDWMTGFVRSRRDAETRSGEAYAEVFSTDMMERMGLGDGIYEALTVSYDARTYVSGKAEAAYDVGAELREHEKMRAGRARGPGQASFAGVADSMSHTDAVLASAARPDHRVSRAVAVAQAFGYASAYFGQDSDVNASSAEWDAWLKERAFIPEISRAVAARQEIADSIRTDMLPDPSRYADLGPEPGDPVAQAAKLDALNEAWAASAPSPEAAREVAKDFRMTFSMIAEQSGATQGQANDALERASRDPEWRTLLQSGGSAFLLSRVGVDPETMARSLDIGNGIAIPSGTFPIAGREGWTATFGGSGGWVLKHGGVLESLRSEGANLPAAWSPSQGKAIHAWFEDGAQMRSAIPAADLGVFVSGASAGPRAAAR